MPERARVLVVDDDVEQRALWGALMECMGHAPVRAESGDEALRMLEREAFDLAIATVTMRGMEGMNFGKVIRGMCADLPVVLLAGPGDRVEATLERGMVALLSPVSLDTMESVVTEILARTPGAKKPIA